ncbi:cupin domain-containing protein [Solwaraspora sp. WMMD406]|uniref:cupin domain-containing protein n=1 Tax=Solwaraspora sp. WMMD406 TaxID=3016095 RepID=UPI0024180470|nr:cupin domain-containing protein [Solwaraspora sp. WMMD406]MDG4766274.1 cupin domain-containing protein [Solwaraspora sp. WMMD406]
MTAPPSTVTTPAPGGRNRPALARCVGIEPAKFATAYWGRAPLVSRAADLDGPAGFTDLLDSDAADELLSRRGLRVPFLRVAREGTLVPESAYTGSGGAGAEIADQVLDERLLAQYADGATLVLQGLHRIWPPIIDFAGELGGMLGQPLQVNAYLTPAGNQGFATHYDTHDVFVLQVAGRKHWRIHEPVLVDPLPRHTWSGRADEVACRADGEPAVDVVLEPGDALYLPRGWLHSAAAQQESSIHLTVGVRALTRYSVVETLLDLAVDDRRLRATLPLGLDVADTGQLEPELTEAVDALRDWLTTVSPAEVADRLRQRSWAATRPAPLRPLAQAERIAVLTVDDTLRRRDGLRWRLVPEPDGRVALRIFDRTVSFPGQCALALRAALETDRIRVGDLPGLDTDDDRLVLARRLLREAVVVPDVG